MFEGLCGVNASSFLSFSSRYSSPFSASAIPSHPLSPLIPYSSPHLLPHSSPLLSTGICLGISRWKLYSISGAPYQHTIIMGNHAEQCWIQLGLPLWWHYQLQGLTSPGSSPLSTCIISPRFTFFSPLNHTILFGYELKKLFNFFF